MTSIAELSKTGITVNETILSIENNTDVQNQDIELSKINKIYLDIETRYFIWLLYLMLHAFIFLSVLAANLLPFLTWLLVVIVGVSGLRLIMGPPSKIFIIIELHTEDSLKILLKDRKDRYFEFIKIVNKQIHKQTST